MKIEITKKWFRSRAPLEEGKSVEAGCSINQCDECEDRAIYLFTPTGKKLCDKCYSRDGEIRIGWKQFK